jgi:two-component system response regulator AtoC
MTGTIFVTDDDPSLRSAVIERLSRRRYLVTGFDSGEALLTALDCIAPDLILLDLKMPGLSGLDILKAVRPKSLQSPIIILTAYGTVQDAVDAMKFGASDFIVKTVDLRGLEQAVDRTLGIVRPEAVSPL